jgi:CheY-like chemotaxis protein
MPKSNWNILIVEDEPDGQLVVSGILDYFNVHTTTVASAEDAFHALREGSFSAAVIDLNLPGMDGMSLVRQIRATQGMNDLPCVAITAYHTSTVKAQAIDAGFDGYFAKPFDDTAFIRELERLLSN